MPPVADTININRTLYDEITRDYTGVIEEVSEQERMVTARINTASIDRYRTVIDPQGGDLSKYNKVVLWEHGKDPQRGNLPIGKNVWIRKVGNSITAKTQFGKDAYSRVLFDMYREGMLNGWSVNVLPAPGTFGPPTQAELRARPELEGCETVYRNWELAEYSAVAVPGNAEALTMLERRGIWFPSEVRVKTSEVSEDTEQQEDEEEDNEYRYIRKKGDKWVVYSEAGKVLGTHDSRNSAVKQLQAIEAHKHNKGRSLLNLRQEMAQDFMYMDTRLRTHIHDLLDLLQGRV